MHNHWIAVTLLATLGIPIQSPPARDVAGVMRAVLENIELVEGDTLLAGGDLDPVSRTLLERFVRRRKFPESVMLVAPITLVVETVTVSGRTAVARITYAPAALIPPLDCGRTVSVPLRWDGKWQFKEDEAWINCARPGPSTNSQDEGRLLEAIRLAISEVELEPGVRIVAGIRLSTAAREALSRIANLPEIGTVATDGFTLPAGYFAIQTVEMGGETVTVEGTLGAAGTGDCGTGWSVSLRRRASGWTFGDQRISVC